MSKLVAHSVIESLPARANENLVRELLRSVRFFLPQRFRFRANIFQPSADARFRITRQLGMDTNKDRQIVIRPGEGATGQAAVNRLQIFQKRGDIFWTLPKEEMRKVSQGLLWILSTPIFSPTDPSQVIGILNVDSSRDITPEETDRLSKGAVLIAQFLGLLLKEYEDG